MEEAENLKEGRLLHFQLSRTHINKKTSKSFNMKIFNNSNFNLTLSLLLFLFAFSTHQVNAQAFKHVAASNTITNNWTTIDNALTNNAPDKLVFVSHDYGRGPYVNSPTGVWYTKGKWAIFQQDKKALGANAKFNVMVKSKNDPNAFMHQAASNTISGHITTIDHPKTNNNPNAVLFVTQNYATSGPYNNNPIGVYYGNGKWKIYNQNKEKMPVNAKFNVFIGSKNSFVHTASANNMQGAHVTKINNDLTNGNPDALIFISQYWTAVYNNHPVGLWYSGGKWTIYNEDRVKMPTSAKFNVMVAQPNEDKAPQVSVNAHVKCQVALIDVSEMEESWQWWNKWHEIKQAKTYKETPCTFSGLKSSTYVLVAYNPASVNFDPNNGNPAEASDGVVLEELRINENSTLNYNFVQKDFKNWNCLSCPWLYAYDGKKYVRLTEVIQDVVGEENCQTTRHEIPVEYILNGKMKFRIQEEKEETSYLDRISLTVDGNKIMPVKTSLTEEDKDYVVLEKGDYIDLEFDLSGYTSGDHEIIFECNGFYIPKAEFLEAVYNEYLIKR